MLNVIWHFFLCFLIKNCGDQSSGNAQKFRQFRFNFVIYKHSVFHTDGSHGGWEKKMFDNDRLDVTHVFDNQSSCYPISSTVVSWKIINIFFLPPFFCLIKLHFFLSLWKVLVSILRLLMHRDDFLVQIFDNLFLLCCVDRHEEKHRQNSRPITNTQILDIGLEWAKKLKIEFVVNASSSQIGEKYKRKTIEEVERLRKIR